MMETLAQADTAADDFGVYVHWPFCASKCPYCDFNSYARPTVAEPRYLAACLKELEHYAALTPGKTVTSVFFGGGTPSLMTARTVAAIIDHIAALWPVADDAEITLEANPSSVEAERFAGYRAAGVNRVSIGVQSLQDDVLRFLGRLHTSAEARAAIGIGGRHFDRVSFDLIYARPGQTAGEWRAELGEALAMAAGHLSLYQLTIEPGTAFFALEEKGKLRIPESEEAVELFELTQDMCEAAGLPAYEVSNHAAVGQESRHNLTYWRYGDYVGAGPGAHGRISVGGTKLAVSALSDPAAWAEAVEARGTGLGEHQTLGSRDQAVEMLLMGLRLNEGLNLEALVSKTGRQLSGAGIRMAEEDGLAVCSGGGGRLRASKAGRLVLNSLIAMLSDHLEPAGRGV
jgi:oxygen-independent coproporphyrinogen-3 oxidase